MDFTALKNSIQQYIKQNGSGAITGTILQEVLLAVVQTLGDNAINTLLDDIVSETTNRQNADTALGQSIHNEQVARENAITSLGNAITSKLAEGYLYVGIAGPTTSPGTPTTKVFYLATVAGTYTNFEGLTVTNGINCLKYNGTHWVLEQIIGFDEYPTAGSSRLATSGGTDAEIKSLVGYYTCGTAAGTAAKTITAPNYILLQGGGIKVVMTNKNTASNPTLNINSRGAKPLYYQGERASASNSWEAGEVVEIYYDGTNYYANNVIGGGAGDGAFDISVYNAVEGTPQAYDGFSSAVTNANVPQNRRKGGMSVKFINSTTSKYEQWQLMATTWSTNISDWQGVDDVPTPGSNNLVRSGSVERNEITAYKASSSELTDFTTKSYSIASSGNFSTVDNDNKHGEIAVSEGERYILEGGVGVYLLRWAFVVTNASGSGATPDYVPGTSFGVTPEGTAVMVTIPSGCHYLLWNTGVNYQTRIYKYYGNDFVGVIKNVRPYYPEFTLNTSYAVGDKRSYKGGNWECIVAYNSGNNELEKNASNWKSIENSGSDIVRNGNSENVLSDKIIKIEGFGTIGEGNTGITKVGQYYYNTSSRRIFRAKNISNPLVVDDFDIIPFYNGSIYTYNGELYTWDGNSLVLAKADYNPYGVEVPTIKHYMTLRLSNGVPVLTTGTLEAQTIYYISVKKGDTIRITATFDGEEPTSFTTAFTAENPATVQYSTNVLRFAERKAASIDVKVVSPIEGYLVVYHSSSRYEDMQLESVKPEDVDVATTISTSDSTTYNIGDGSIYLQDLYVTFENQEGSTTIRVRDTIQPLESSFNYVLTKDNNVTTKLTDDLLATDFILLKVNVSNGKYNFFGGYLYADFIKKNTSLSGNPFFGKKIVCTGGSSMEGYTVPSGSPIASEIIGTKLGMTSKNYAIAGSAVAKHQSIIGYEVEYADIYYSTEDWQSAIQGGTLDTTKKYMVKDSESSPKFHIYKYSNDNWIVCDPSEFVNSNPYLADYDECFVSQEDWQTAIQGGTLDTTKTYLVKDYSVRPYYHLYRYSNGNWERYLPYSDSLTNVDNSAKIPLVDRIREMDTDADVVIIDSGGNDFAHYWTPMGNDLSRDKDTFCGAMHLICQYLVDTYPGKVIMWTSRPAAWRYSDENRTPAVVYDNFYTRWDAPNAYGYTSQDYEEKKKMILREYGINYFDLGARLGFSQHNRWWCGDTPNGGFYAHPNAEAQPLIADVLIKEILSYRT